MYISHFEGILNFSCGWVWKMRSMLTYLSLSLETESETIELVETESLAILWPEKQAVSLCNGLEK